MRINRKIIIAGVVGVVLIGALVFALSEWSSGNNPQFTLSGTIEATEIHLSTRKGGLVKEVYVE